MAVKLGMACKLYRQTSGTRAAWPGSGSAPDLTEVANVKDVTLNLETGDADVTTRANNGWRAKVGTLKDGSVEFEMIWDTEDEGFAAMQAAFFNNTSIAIAVLDGDASTAGTQGLWADFSVTNFSREEPLEDAVKAKVTIKPTYSAVGAEWVTVG